MPSIHPILLPSVAFTFFVSFFTIVSYVTALGATDTITWGGDNSRSGYQDNHNLDPSIVGSANFGQIFRTPLPGNYKGIGPEQVFSQPLVFTGGDGIQHVYIATTQNNIYKLDVKTGEILLQRNLHVPFLTADLDGCVDINPAVGVTATGVIDPATGIWYVLAKTYSEAYQNNVLNPAQPPGRLKGRYYFHAIHTETLAEVQGFPINLEGLLFRNNKNRMFLGGNQHARPGFLQMGDFIYTGFASHCVQYNFTGAIIGFNKNTGAIVEAFATQGGIEPNSIPGGGVWMSGGGIASDGQGSMFFSTGNGYASQLKEDGAPVPGRQPPTALEEAAVNAKVNDDGTITIVDFFMPWEKVQLDGADKDLGTTPLQLLPSQFACPNVRRMGVVTGKSGKTYWLDINNLGGYQMGPNKQDAVPQVYQNENSVYAGAGIYPLDGGYVYVNVIQFQTHVFKFSCNSQGNPQFSLVANTPEKNAYVLGTGHGTTTSLNGQPGTGLLWVSDVEGINLRIYKAVPDGGSMTLIKGFDIPGVVKFTRPVFGDGRVYIGTQGYVYGFGSPVNLPLNCSSPYDFGTTPVDGASTPRTIRCIANIATQVIGIGLTSGRDFVLSGLPTVPFQLAQGAALTFQAAFTPKSVGPLAGQVLVNTTNPIAGYSIFTPITLKGTANSPRPVLSISPKQVNFTTIVGENPNGVVGSTIFSNLGDSPLTINNITYSLVSERGPWVTPVVTGGGVQVGPFTFSDLPTTISGGSSVTVEINYNPKTAGNNVVYAQINTDGGSAFLDVFGTASTYPGALVEFENADGSGWTRYQEGVPFSFGSVLRSQTKTLRLRVTNSGTASAAPLSITVSKPPFGVGGIIGAVNNIDLAEGASIPAGQSATASLFCSVPGSQVNLPSYGGSASWTMNTGDPNLGKLFMSFTCTAVTEQLGPRLQNGTAQYGYVGCFKENNPERQLAIMAYGDQGNENGRCINACFSLNYRFAATQYQSECWCGNAIPNDLDPEEDCNYLCSGNRTQTCGGDGYFHNQAHMSLFADKLRFDGNTTAEPIHIVQSVGRYNYLGCYSENNGKAFNQKVTATDAMTTQFCADFCGAYDYFGLEYASECYCGTTLNAAVATKVTDGQCNMACKGTNSEYCGAGSRMQVYKANGTAPTTSTSVTSAPTSNPTGVGPLANYTYMGCYSETSDRRALLSPKGLGGGPTNTRESCAQFCLGYNYFGVEYGSECYCGNEIYSKSAKQQNEDGCNVPCAGNPNQMCGGGNFLNIFFINATGTSPSSTSAGPTPTETGPATVPSAGVFRSLGCYNEIPGRALTGPSFSNSSNSIQFCASFCTSYQFFGVEYGSECYCGNSLGSGSLPATGCTVTCAANPLQYCGGGDRLNLYIKNSTTVGGTFSSSSAATASPIPTGPSVVPRAGNYVSMGCYNEKPNGRSLGVLYPDDQMTIQLCASQATSGKWNYFGVEFGRECWMGNTTDPLSLLKPQNNCNMVCPGNSSQWCGAGNYLQMYNLTTATVLPLAATIPSSPSPTVTPTRSSSVSSTSGLMSASASLAASSSLTSLPVSSRSTSSRSSTISSTVPSTSSRSTTVSSSSRSGSSSSSTIPSSSPTTSSILSSNHLSSLSTSSIPLILRESSTSSTSPSSSALRPTTSSLPPSSSLRLTTTSVPSSSSVRTTASSAPGTTSSSTRPASIRSTTSSTPLTSSRPTTSSTPLTSARTASTSTSSARPVALATVSSYTHQGCYTEGTSGRALPALSYTNTTAMSPTSCASFCTQYAWFGVENGKECYCGPYVKNGAQNLTMARQGECSYPCSGNKGFLCGGNSRINMYYSSSSSKVDTDPVTVQREGRYTFYSCVTDSRDRRALTTRVLGDDMTVQKCMGIAERGDYSWAGVEVGRECWMGNILDAGSRNVTKSSTESGCSTGCRGDPRQACGGGDRISLYKRV